MRAGRDRRAPRPHRRAEALANASATLVSAAFVDVVDVSRGAMDATARISRSSSTDTHAPRGASFEDGASAALVSAPGGSSGTCARCCPERMNGR